MASTRDGDGVVGSNRRTTTIAPEARATYAAYVAARGEVERGERTWASLAEQFFTDDAVFVDPAWGRTEGRAEIARFFEESMPGLDDWTFPEEWTVVEGDRVISLWWNRLPGERDDGRPHQAPGLSVLHYAGEGRFDYEFDLLNMAEIAEVMTASGWTPPPTASPSTTFTSPTPRCRSRTPSGPSRTWWPTGSSATSACRTLPPTRGDTVVLGTRDLDAGQRAAAPLVATGGDVRARLLDVTDQASIDAVAAELASGNVGSGPGRLDVLVNNAAIHYDTWQNAAGADLGAWRCTNAFLPLLRASGHGRIVNVSNEGGSLTSMGGGTRPTGCPRPGSTTSPACSRPNCAPTASSSTRCAPGWAATDMGGPGGRPVAEGAASVMWAVDLPDDGPTGGFFRAGRALPW